MNIGRRVEKLRKHLGKLAKWKEEGLLDEQYQIHIASILRDWLTDFYPLINEPELAPIAQYMKDIHDQYSEPEAVTAALAQAAEQGEVYFAGFEMEGAMYDAFPVANVMFVPVGTPILVGPGGQVGDLEQARELYGDPVGPELGLPGDPGQRDGDDYENLENRRGIPLDQDEESDG